MLPVATLAPLPSALEILVDPDLIGFHFSGNPTDQEIARCCDGVRVGVECEVTGRDSSHKRTAMGPADLQRFQSLLLKKQHELSSALGEAHSRVPAAGGLPGDMIDQANADAEAELQIRLHRTDGRLARAIDQALARIKQSTYGVCEVCKQPISEARLEAVPWTHLCRECKELER